MPARPLLALLFAALVVAVPTSSQVSAGHVSYWNSSHGCCGPKVTMILEVCHPCSGCLIPVEVCLPACCEGSPRVSSRSTLIGYGLTKYTWHCGRSVTIRFWSGDSVTVAYN